MSVNDALVTPEYREGGMRMEEIKLLVDQLIKMGAIPDARRETGGRDHQAAVRQLLEALGAVCLWCSGCPFTPASPSTTILQYGAGFA